MVKCPDLSVRPCVAEPCGLRLAPEVRAEHEDYWLCVVIDGEHEGTELRVKPENLEAPEPDLGGAALALEERGRAATPANVARELDRRLGLSGRPFRW